MTTDGGCTCRRYWLWAAHCRLPFVAAPGHHPPAGHAAAGHQMFSAWLDCGEPGGGGGFVACWSSLGDGVKADRKRLTFRCSLLLCVCHTTKPAGTALPTANTVPPGIPPSFFERTQEREVLSLGSGLTVFYNTITAMPAYSDSSVEEIRWQDRQAGFGCPSQSQLPLSSFAAQVSAPSSSAFLFPQPPFNKAPAPEPQPLQQPRFDWVNVPAATTAGAQALPGRPALWRLFLRGRQGLISLADKLTPLKPHSFRHGHSFTPCPQRSLAVLTLAGRPCCAALRADLEGFADADELAAAAQPFAATADAMTLEQVKVCSMRRCAQRSRDYIPSQPRCAMGNVVTQTGRCHNAWMDACFCCWWPHCRMHCSTTGLQELIESHRSRELPTFTPYAALESLIDRFQGRRATRAGLAAELWGASPGPSTVAVCSRLAGMAGNGS